MLFARPAAPFLFDGKAVVDLQTGDSTGRISIEGKDRPFTEEALSPDGKVYAMGAGGSSLQLKSIRLFSTTHDRQVHQLDLSEFGDRLHVEHLRFAEPRTLLAFCKAGVDARVFVFDVAKGERIKDIESEFTTDEPVVSPTGQHFLVGRPPDMKLFSLETNRTLEEFEDPVDARVASSFGSLMAFSPSGKEFGCAVGGHVVCWDLRGKVSYCAPGAPIGFGQRPFQWLPDESGWLINNRYVYLREPKQVVWEIRSTGPCQFLDRDQVATLHGQGEQRQAIVLKCPWDRVQQALAARSTGTPAWIAPGAEVSLQIDIGGLQHGEPAAVEQEIRKRCEPLIGSSQLTVSDTADLRLRIAYSEVAGDKIASDQNGETPCGIHASLTVQGREAPLWRREFASKLAGGPRDPADKRSEQTLNFLLIKLSAELLPSFMPQDEKTPGLPLITDLAER